jgi:hypothetical protein
MEPFAFRLMSVAKDADVRLFAIQEGSPGLCELPAFIHNATDRDAEAGQSDHRLGRKSALSLIVDVVKTTVRLDVAMLRHDHRLAQFGRTIN